MHAIAALWEVPGINMKLGAAVLNFTQALKLPFVGEISRHERWPLCGAARMMTLARDRMPGASP